MKGFGADISCHDPLVSEFAVGEEVYTSKELRAGLLRGHDCAVIVTHHSKIDVGLVVEEPPLVFDTRNATDGYDGRDNVERL